MTGMDGMDASLTPAMISTRDELVRRLQSFTPGAMDDRGDHNLNPDMPPDDVLKPAAVLILIVQRPEGFTVLFTQRTDHLYHHPGQVSFPGGHRDDNDSSLEQTALRETEEEVGIDPQLIELVGRISQYKTRTGFEITPVVGIIQPGFEMNPDSFEVADVFEVPLSFLMDPANHMFHTIDYKGFQREFYAMSYEDYYIWGATAGMLVNFYQILRDS